MSKTNYGNLTPVEIADGKYYDFTYSECQKFINRFVFEGDEKFNRINQRLFLGNLWYNGYAGIHKFKAGLRVPVKVSPVGYGYDGTIQWGYGIKASPAYTDKSFSVSKLKRKTFKVNANDTAFCMYDIFTNSGQALIDTDATIYGEAWAVLRTNYKWTQILITFKGSDNEARSLADAIEDIDVTVFSTNGRKRRYGADNKISASELLDGDKIEIINNGEKDPRIAELLSVISHIKADYSDNYGRRGSNVKGDENVDRHINAEFQDHSIGIELMEFSVKDMLENFVENYNRVFKTNLTLIDRLDQLKVEPVEEENDMENLEGEDNE